MMTINEIALKLNVTRAVAYGFLNFLSAQGILKHVGTKRIPNERGKPAHLYQFTEEDILNLVGVLQPLFAEPAPAQVELPQVVTETMIVAEAVDGEFATAAV